MNHFYNFSVAKVIKLHFSGIYNYLLKCKLLYYQYPYIIHIPLEQNNHTTPVMHARILSCDNYLSDRLYTVRPRRINEYVNLIDMWFHYWHTSIKCGRISYPLIL